MGAVLRPGFYFITDSRLTERDVVSDTAGALAGGAALVQYREKKLGLEECRREAKELLELCRRAGVPFLVNDLVELARELGADGAHVGQEDLPLREARRLLGPAAVIGVSAGSVEEARAGEADGASYVAVSPVFSTSTKADAGPGLGLEMVTAIRAAVSIPVAAIGGIGPSNIRSVRDAGAGLLCAISASLAGGRVEENVRELGRLAGF